MIEPHYTVGEKPPSENDHRFISKSTGRLVRPDVHRVYKEVASAELRKCHFKMRQDRATAGAVWSPADFEVFAVIYQFTMRGGRDVDNCIKITKDCLFKTIGRDDSASKAEALFHRPIHKDGWQGTQIWVFDLKQPQQREEFVQCFRERTEKTSGWWRKA